MRRRGSSSAVAGGAGGTGIRARLPASLEVSSRPSGRTYPIGQATSGPTPDNGAMTPGQRQQGRRWSGRRTHLSHSRSRADRPADRGDRRRGRPARHRGGRQPGGPTVPVAVGAVIATIHVWLFRWSTLIALVFLVILLIPMKRYALLPGRSRSRSSPTAADRCGDGGWIATLLVERSMRIRRTGLEIPLLGFVLRGTDLGVVNHRGVTYSGQRRGRQEGHVPSELRGHRLPDHQHDHQAGASSTMLISVLVWCGAVVGGLQPLRVAYRLQRLRQAPRDLPAAAAGEAGRRTPATTADVGGRLRSSRPLSIRSRSARRSRCSSRWPSTWLTARSPDLVDRRNGVLGIGVLATVSRTGIVMMITLLICYW